MKQTIKLFIVLSNLLLSQTTFSQNNLLSYKSFCVFDKIENFDFLWFNIENNEFCEGISFVSYGEKWGAIDSTGKQVIDFKYDERKDFSDGLAAVALNGKWGYVNKHGTLVVPIKYDSAEKFIDGVACIKLNEKYGAINKKGVLVVPTRYDNTFSFEEGLACVQLNGKYGFVNKQGSVIIPIKHEHASSFSEGLAAVQLNGKYGYVNKQGALVIPYKYDDAASFSEGISAVKQNSRYGYIDKTGKTILPFTYSSAGSFKNGIASAKYVKIEGKDIENSTEEVQLFAGLLALADALAIEYIDKTGKRVDYGRLGVISDGLFFKEHDNKYGYCDLNGNWVIPCIYDEANNFSEGYALVKKNGKYGYVNKQGVEITQFIYEKGGNFSEGLAWVKKNGKYGYINNHGKEITPFVFNDGWNFSESLACVEIDGKFGFIDKNGNPLELDLNGDACMKCGLSIENKLREENLSDEVKSQIRSLAFSWFNKGAIKGHLNCCYAIGFYYYEGYCSDKNYLEAVKWLSKATGIENSNGNAQLYLGYCYSEGGYGITKDDNKAFRYFSDGAKYNNEGCYYALAVSYYNGLGCPTNPLQACVYADKLYNSNKTKYALIYANCHNSLAYDYAKKKNYTQAIISIDKSIKTNVEGVENYYDSKGEILLMMGKEAEALEMWKKVMDINPNYLDNYPDGTELSKGLKTKGLI